MGTINDYHKMVEFIAKFMEGVTSVHGDDTAKHKAYPVIEATMAFFRRGENAGGKFVPEEKRSFGSKLKRYFRQWDEVHAVLQNGHKANSIAQQYYNVEALALDRHQTYLAMEELVANGLMGHDQEEEVKKRFSGILPFIWRMILESFLRTAKITSVMTAKNLLGSSFKGVAQ
jgi:hypothetical protein